MKETLGERIKEKIFGGAKGEVRYYRTEAKNADLFIRENQRIIEAFKKKYPKDWKKRIGGYGFDLKYFKKTKQDALKSLKRWKAIEQAHKRLHKVM